MSPELKERMLADLDEKIARWNRGTDPRKAKLRATAKTLSELRHHLKCDELLAIASNPLFNYHSLRGCWPKGLGPLVALAVGGLIRVATHRRGHQLQNHPN